MESYMGIDPEELNFSEVKMSFAQKTITIDDVKSIVTVARENLRNGSDISSWNF